ncbi:MAG: aminoacyl-tRNA hydrolase [Candidatus Dormibacteraeota bacterium]|uniref:Peptidyl-tRNA hydrolase n=1 Tax=Candidatus Dormiibacter inghamiae TaxID=3127013 RepID=A0A934KH09_9BACT|nr:aminoacyl-tRNA hydrolase [Candidatus Dormibacteraeota bacterium]MBJ7605106.1 aminoacyl-tRNA hydrolase [Candidatus Dormibacteraeota bacterium]
MPEAEIDQGAPSDLLVVGLGNPGREYRETRHNLGWRCLDALAARLGTSLDGRRWHSRVNSLASGGRRVWLVQPQTFMNESGRAVKAACRDLQVGPESLWLVHDELDLPLCRLRIRRGGSAAGHNGVTSLITSLGSPDFVRFRIGVGKPPTSGAEAGRRYVLSRFSRAEAQAAKTVVEGVAEALQIALSDGLDKAMAVYNRAGSLGCEEIP